MEGGETMEIADITTGITNLTTVVSDVMSMIKDNAALMVIFCVSVVGAGAATFRKVCHSVK